MVQGVRGMPCRSEPRTTAKNSFLKYLRGLAVARMQFRALSGSNPGHPTDPLFRTEYDREELFPERPFAALPLPGCSFALFVVRIRAPNRPVVPNRVRPRRTL